MLAALQCCRSAAAVKPPHCYTETDCQSALTLGRAHSSPQLLLKDMNCGLNITLSLKCLGINANILTKTWKKKAARFVGSHF